MPLYFGRGVPLPFFINFKEVFCCTRGAVGMKKMKKIMGIITGTCALFVLCSISVQAQENSISMGGLFGKGIMNGTQAALKFLPEAPTDFIFCVLAEETGFVGVVVLLVLYAALIVVSLKIVKATDDLFGKLLVVCCVGM